MFFPVTGIKSHSGFLESDDLFTLPGGEFGNGEARPKRVTPRESAINTSTPGAPGFQYLRCHQGLRAESSWIEIWRMEVMVVGHELISDWCDRFGNLMWPERFSLLELRQHQVIHQANVSFMIDQKGAIKMQPMALIVTEEHQGAPFLFACPAKRIKM